MAAFGQGASKGYELAYKGLAQFRPIGYGLSHELFEVDHLHAVVRKGLGEGVVLPLGCSEIGYVVEQKLLEAGGGQVLKLQPRPVQQDLFQWARFAGNMYRH